MNFLIVEDHPSIRTSVKIMLSSIVPGSKFTEKSNFLDALGYLKSNTCDFIILDIGIPGGNHIGMIDKLRKLQADVPILIFSGCDESLYALPYISAGANGYISKTSTESEFRDAILCVLNHRKFLSNNIQQQIISTLGNQGQTDYNPILRLSNRETDIMTLILNGHSSKEIGVITDLKMSTISTVKLNIFEKMKVSNVIDLYKKVELLKMSY
jgi:two-component system invasion response regulator UvrY